MNKHFLGNYLHADESELADEQLVIKEQVPEPAGASLTVDALNTQTPSVPPELHDVLVMYTEHLSLRVQTDPPETQLVKTA